MSRSKKPVIIVGACLSALILLPVIIVVIARIGSNGGSVPSLERDTESAGEVQFVDYNLSQLAEKAAKLLNEELADALRKGDVSLDYVAGLKKEVDRANEEMRNGRLRKAKERFVAVVSSAEAQLEAIAAADKARALKDQTYAELQRLEHLRPAFENTYREAVETYNKALRGLEVNDFAQSLADFELASAILGDLEARAIQQIANLLDSAQASLNNYELYPARKAYESALDIDAANRDATEGLTMVTALEGIAEEVKAIRTLEETGQLEEALAALEILAAAHPNNPFIKNQRLSLETRIVDRDFNELIKRSVEEEQAGDLAAAIVSVEAALKLKADPIEQKRLAELQERYKAVRLEMLLADGFQALKDARYESARNLYKEAVALNPDSKEARTGLEKASSLYLANIRYDQNIGSAERYIEDGRFPLAAKLFNDAMSSRPGTVSSEQEKKEQEIRRMLEMQSKEVDLLVKSDGRTYVSIIGVLPPDRFKSTDLKLFPDVYKVRGSRKGYQNVEFEIKIDATKDRQTIEVVCTQKI